MDDKTIMYLAIGGVLVYLFLQQKPVQAATPVTAPTLGQTTPVAPGQTPIGNPLIAQLVGLAAGFVGTQMAQTR